MHSTARDSTCYTNSELFRFDPPITVEGLLPLVCPPRHSNTPVGKLDDPERDLHNTADIRSVRRNRNKAAPTANPLNKSDPNLPFPVRTFLVPLVLPVEALIVRLCHLSFHVDPGFSAAFLNGTDGNRSFPVRRLHFCYCFFRCRHHAYIFCGPRSCRGCRSVLGGLALPRTERVRPTLSVDEISLGGSSSGIIHTIITATVSDLLP